MKKYFVLISMAVMILSTACSSDEDYSFNLDDAEITGIAQNKWDGQGIPSWLKDKIFEYYMEHGCGWSSLNYMVGHCTADAYKFHCNDLPFVAIRYKVNGGRVYNGANQQPTVPLQWGLDFFTNDGRKIKSKTVEKAFNEQSELIFSRHLEQKTPETITLPTGEEISWLGKEVETIYNNYNDECVLESIVIKYDSDENLVAIAEISMTSTESTTQVRFFTLDGKELSDRTMSGTYEIITEIKGVEIWTNNEYVEVAY